jgi:ubiquinol-cytochrome c reductase iron-sulfur subunit
MTQTATGDKLQRRRVLLGATSIAGGAAAAFATAPFVASMAPSRKARAEGGPVRVNFADLPPGQLRVVAWRRKPVWFLHRTSEMLALLAAEDNLVDPQSESSNQPEYCRNRERAIKPRIFVAFGICTHLGCSPGGDGEGFLCACHGSRFDFAGRVFKNSPAPSNLMIPPHRYAGADEIVVGEEA